MTPTLQGIRSLLLTGLLSMAPGHLPAAMDDTAHATGAWEAPMGRDHPLTGRIWDSARGAFIDERTLLDRLVDVRFVVTGESHNNPDHHRLQLRILRAMFGNGRRVAVGFEIFTSEDQPALDQFATLTAPRDHDPAHLLGNGRRHRELWEQYRPLVGFAAGAGLPLVAANLSRRETAAVLREGVGALAPALVERFGLDRPLDAAREETLKRDMLRAHCGMLFSADLDGLMLAQRARDATMAQRMEQADVGGGALLLAGYGHARGDRGVPYLLAGRQRSGELVSLLFASVKADMTAADDYGQWFESGSPPFDYVWFTPRVDDEDPCDRLRIYRKGDGARRDTSAPASVTPPPGLSRKAAHPTIPPLAGGR